MYWVIFFEICILTSFASIVHVLYLP
uniref:Uncharacterized protein n=1 Tax=Rhizophora mucronata TaxID=61149 RepID=A0A2P2MXU7_RHIMU